MEKINKHFKPHFFLPGAAKSGTTTLHELLNNHPDISMSKNKEPVYWNNKKFSSFTKNEIENFKSLFDMSSKITGESTISYMYYDSFLKKYADDTTSGQINAAGFVSTGDITAEGDVVAQRYVVKSSVSEITSSFSSGSTIFGDSTDDTHRFTGSLLITGSQTLVGRITPTEIGAFTAKGAIDFDNQDMTNVDIDSGDIASGVTINKSPEITLGGDLSGDVTLTNLGDGTLNATIAANSVALSTDTKRD